VSRVIGLDPGTRRIGVAVSNSARTMAFPRSAVIVGDTALDDIRTIINDEHAELVVVGYPRSLSGDESASSRRVDDFVTALTDSVVGVQFVTFDERLTTASARRNLHDAGRSDKEQRSVIDSEAAAILLQSFLDATTP
jgi:putative Holliday junction resolvase